MKIVEKIGNILESESNVICHQVNCQAAMGSGLAKAIRWKYPIVYEQYTSFLDNNYIRDASGLKLNTSEFLGLCQLVKVDENKYVANIFGQDRYGKEPGVVYTNYHAVLISLYNLKRLVLFGNYNIKSIAFPYGMGAGLAGGDWNVIYNLITGVFQDTDVEIIINKLEN